MVELVKTIMSGEGTGAETQAWVARFEDSVPHPEPSGLIFHADLSADEVVERALAYRPIRLP